MMNTNAVTIATTTIKRYIQSKIDRDTFNITIKSRQVMVHVTLIHKTSLTSDAGLILWRDWEYTMHPHTP